MLKVVKIGGNVVDAPEKLSAFLHDFAALPGEKILVHGGGKVATTISRSLGIETQMIGGRRVTDERTLEVVTMVYAGGINKRIVAALQAEGCNAIGLCGADARFILSHRRSSEPVDYGFVGDPDGINTELVELLTGAGYTLVVAPITSDGKGTLLNTNADTVAQTVATGLAAAGVEVELVYCFEKQGVLRDIQDEDSVVPEITERDFERLKADGVVDGGMLPKLENAFRAIDGGVKRVVICSAERIASPGYGGTTLRKA